MVRRHFYGTCAVVLGAWEAAAYATRRVPTVTRTCRSLHGAPRYRLAARALVLIWAAGLARHLLGDDA